MADRILIVDDEEDIRVVLKISLSDLGYEVYTAENGEEALRIIEEITPPIVLTDIRMPVMDGIELLRKIKQEDPETEVIMITGHGDMDLAIKSLKHEATDFITKPIKDEVLEIALKRANERISMRRQLREYTEHLEDLVREKSAKLIKAERLIAVGQVVEGLSSAMKNIVEDLESGLTFFNEMPCFVSIHNSNNEVVGTNQLYKERLGNKIGRGSWEIYSSSAGSQKNCPVAKTFSTGKGQRRRERVKNLNGSELPVMVHTAPVRNRDGEVELVLEMAADLTEVSRLQEELISCQQRYQQLFDAAPCYFTVQDRDLKLMAANKKFLEDFGIKFGSFCSQAYSHDGEPHPECPVWKTFEEGESQQAETVVTAKSGEQYNVLIWTAPIKNVAGEVTHVMEMSTNITQIRQLQDHLSSLGLLIGSISHGIKGLLTGLDGGMYRIESGFEKEDLESIKEGWEIVRHMIGRIRNMSLDLLYYAKERDLQWERTDVLTFANDVALTVEPKALGHNIEFVRDFDASAGEFEVDAGVLASAMTNILENALDACIHDDSKRAHKITFGVRQDKDNIIFDVSDNGIGMDKEAREKMFTLFYSSKGREGTGLGLFISNQIIEQHEGSVQVDSTPGEGSRFIVRMPKILPEEIKTPQKN
ncbi:MAG: response regulator [Deltaproteobacteria bacterium]|nr:MAG: response regulator [Deltaproteobacteria bacterium]